MKIFSKIKQLIFKWRYRQLDSYTKEYLSYLDQLFARAAGTSGFQYLCTILRVEGIKSGHWDAFVEAEEATTDFSKLLHTMRKKRQKKRVIRMGLFLYCHLTEMSAPYEILANLLCCMQGKSYKMFPFAHLVKVNNQKQGIFTKRHLPYLKNKIEYIRELANICGEQKLLEIIDGFFRNDVRNAFYHSDYTISDKEFRIIEGGEMGKQSLYLEELSELLTKCFAFYSAFFISYNLIKRGLVQGNKFHRWPNYEVLELLSNKDGLSGFKVHFPSGSYAMFEREKYKGTMALNILFEGDKVGFMVGDLNKYEKADNWYVGNNPFQEYGTRYNQYGFWRPIIFKRDSSKIQQMIQGLTDNKVAQGSLFYIYTTGHAAIEFVVKSNRPLFRGKSLKRPIFSKKKQLELVLFDNSDSKNFLYDGTMYLKTKNTSDVINGLEKINLFIRRYTTRGINVRYRLKYQLYSDGSEGRKQSKGKGFSITLSMDDPRSTLVANDLGIFPQTDWHIKEEWI